MLTNPGQPEASKPAPQRDGLTIAQLIISGLGMVLSLLAAGLLALVGLITLASDNTSSTEAGSTIGLAWVALLVGLLAVPSLYYAYHRISGRTPSVRLPNGHRLSGILILLWPLVVALGGFTANTGIAWLILPPLTLAAVALPLWWLVERARWKLGPNQPQRAWGLLNFGLFISTPFAVISEIIVFAVIFVLVVIWIATRPDLAQQLEELGRSVIESQSSPEEVFDLLAPYMQNPLAIFGAAGLLAGLVPMMEELIKPMGILLLAGRKPSPAQGFAAGAVCGASFALLESLLNISGPAGSSWLWLVTGRAGTGLLHITTSALVGWGIATALSGRRGFGRMLLAYATAVALHGLWNLLSLVSGLGTVFESSGQPLQSTAALAPAATAGLVVMVLLLFALLSAGNRILRREANPPAVSEPGRPE